MFPQARETRPSRQAQPITVSRSPPLPLPHALDHLFLNFSTLSFGSHHPRPKWQHANPSNYSLSLPPLNLIVHPVTELIPLVRPTADSIKKCSSTRLPSPTASPRSPKLAPAQPRYLVPHFSSGRAARLSMMITWSARRKRMGGARWSACARVGR